MSLKLTPPQVLPPLDEDFRPAILANQNFQREVESVGVRTVIGVERSGGEVSRFETKVYPEGHPNFESNYQYIERIVKFLLWQRGGHTLHVGGSPKIAEYLKKAYSRQGSQKFDFDFMGTQVYEKEFSVISCDVDEVPASRETGKLLGRNLQGHRIGFDLGASDRKVSAVVDGTPIYSEEVIWEPRKNSDPEYHYREVMTALKTAASKMPRVDAIGGSSAGIYIDNRPMVASLFRGISQEKFSEIKNMFLRIRDELGVPLEVINDGDVTALAGSMSIEDNGILGIALGSSEAAGYVNMEGHIMGWLNELAFAPIDYSPNAPVEEWSGDKGCGASYFSQQCVFRLAPKAGIEIPADVTDAEKLKFVQERLEAGHEGALKIWQSMGVYLGYGIAHYADFYDIKHVLILGRCTSGRGGDLLLEGAKKVFETEFPDLVGKIELHLPDEKIRRVGQSVAAASLPAI
ncbi:ROK family protein [Candidatus Villigracilis affinis]|uniref:ROK family protein n=1 Tax=Candidatus Villigracilis affinis TaxID=3140682 RepID=UPI002A23698B|nr:ROK family protein [Anaerolineales bacterium]